MVAIVNLGPFSLQADGLGQYHTLLVNIVIPDEKVPCSFSNIFPLGIFEGGGENQLYPFTFSQPCMDCAFSQVWEKTDQPFRAKVET